MEVVLEPVEISDDLGDRPLGLLLRRSGAGRQANGEDENGHARAKSSGVDVSLLMFPRWRKCGSYHCTMRSNSVRLAQM